MSEESAKTGKRLTKAEAISGYEEHGAVTRARVEGERSMQDDKGKRWPMYATGMQEYIKDLKRVFPSAEHIPEDIREKKELTGEPILVVDVAGLADGSDIGADITVNLVLERGPEMPGDTQNRIIVDGDLINLRIQQQLEKVLDKQGVKISYVFFRPGLAFAGEENNPVVQVRLLSLFNRLYERLDKDGEIYCNTDVRGNYLDQLVPILEEHKIPFEFEGNFLRVSKP